MREFLLAREGRAASRGMVQRDDNGDEPLLVQGDLAIDFSKRQVECAVSRCG